MNSKQPGTHSSSVEVTRVSSHGMLLLTEDRELFLPYDAEEAGFATNSIVLSFLGLITNRL